MPPEVRASRFWHVNLGCPVIVRMVYYHPYVIINASSKNNRHTMQQNENNKYGMVSLNGCRCRCGHEWLPRTSSKPRVCPRCKSPYWDKHAYANTKPMILNNKFVDCGSKRSGL